MERVWELLLAELFWWKHDLLILYCVLVLCSIGYDFYCYQKKKQGNGFHVWWVWLISIWAFPLMLIWLWITASKKTK